jgi:excisionase family DNA binding protein
VSLEETIAEVVRRVVREELAAIRPASPDVMTVEQAATHTGRAPKTIRGWLLAGLPSARKGRRIHIRRADLDEWMTRPEASTEGIVAKLRRVG